MVQTSSDKSDQVIMLQILHPLQLYQQVPGHADVLGGDVLEGHHGPLVLGGGDVLLPHLPKHGVLGDPGHHTAATQPSLADAIVRPLSHPAMLDLLHFIKINLPSHRGYVCLLFVMLEYQQRA